jgi:hypothetical protein
MIQSFCSFSLLVSMGFVFFGCQTTRTITGPDGTPHQLITCQAIEYCYEDATKVCGGKYRIVNTSSQVETVFKETSSTTKLLVKCESAF